jgi:16S rRNA (uracil1498-N3)-methyltransferase
MPQFMLKLEDIDGQHFVLKGPEAFHVTRVLRRKEGSEIELFDGKGGKYTGVIRTILADGTVEGDITKRSQAPMKTVPVDLHLYLGVLKKPSNWEWALEKGTELGVASFTPVITPRTIVQARDISKNKISRWQKIMEGAAKQSERGTLPALKEPQHFRDAIPAAAKRGLVLLGWERHPGATTYAGLREVLRKARAENKKGLTISLFIGPEGGFSKEELEIAEYEDANFFSLGPNVLRAETAAVSAAAIILYELGTL